MISGWRANDGLRRSRRRVGGVSADVPTIQSFSFGSLPAGAPGTVQPSSVSPSSSNEVEPCAGRDVDVVDERRRAYWKMSSLA